MSRIHVTEMNGSAICPVGSFQHACTYSCYNLTSDLKFSKRFVAYNTYESANQLSSCHCESLVSLNCSIFRSYRIQHHRAMSIAILLRHHDLIHMLFPVYACLKNIGANPSVIAFFILYNPPSNELL